MNKFRLFLIPPLLACCLLGGFSVSKASAAQPKAQQAVQTQNRKAQAAWSLPSISSMVDDIRRAGKKIIRYGSRLIQGTYNKARGTVTLAWGWLNKGFWGGPSGPRGNCKNDPFNPFTLKCSVKRR